MSDGKPKATLSPGRETPSPEYRYQSFSGKSGSVSAKPQTVPERKFAELQNLVLHAN
jgi:hypothetical protein